MMNRDRAAGQPRLAAAEAAGRGQPHPRGRQGRRVALIRHGGVAAGPSGVFVGAERRHHETLAPSEEAVVQHSAMADAYRRTGGLLSGDQTVLLLRGHAAQPISRLARWIVGRRIVSYVWQAQTLVPLFQFDRADMSLRNDASQVIDELADTFDDWELAEWFAQPNAWLQGAAPVDLIDADLPAVLQAARADRFIARG
jgi:hypothetical protein